MKADPMGRIHRPKTKSGDILYPNDSQAKFTSCIYDFVLWSLRKLVSTR